MDFGKKVRLFLRKSKNLSQTQLGDQVGVKKSVISLYEIGRVKPSYKVLEKLSEVLNVSTDYLLGIDTEDKDDPDISQLSLFGYEPKPRPKKVRREKLTPEAIEQITNIIKYDLTKDLDDDSEN